MLYSLKLFSSQTLRSYSVLKCWGHWGSKLNKVKVDLGLGLDLKVVREEAMQVSGER